MSNSEITQMLELPDKDFKEAIIKILRKVKTNYLEINERVESLRKRNRRYEKMEIQT